MVTAVSPEKSKRWYDVHDVAEMLDVKPTTVRNWIARGTIPRPITISTHTLRWKVETIEQWLIEREQAAG